MGGKWNGKSGLEMCIMLAVSLAVAWPRPGFAANQIAPASPMTPVDLFQLNTAGNGTSDSPSADGVTDSGVFSGDSDSVVNSVDAGKRVRPTPLMLSQTSDVALVTTGVASGSNEKAAARAEETPPAAPAGETPSSLQFAPIRFWGAIGYELRRETIDAQTQTMHLLTTKVNASTFIWRPWFALVSGGLGFNTSTSNSASGKGKNNFVTGNAALNLLP